MKARAGNLPAALAGCVLAAAISLAFAFEPLYDPWAWLVWGRELAALDLDTSAGPSWKPLPALIAAPLSLLGDAAPQAWLLIARAAWLAVPVLAWRLAARLEGSGGSRAVVAGALAALGALLIADDVTAWTRQATGGLAEPLLAALALGAIDAALGGRARLALWLALAACLVRPEAWPFALLFAWREARAGRVGPGAVGAGAAAVAALWFGPDLLAAGNALEGAGRARGAGNSPAEALGWALAMPLGALWAGAAALVVCERRAGVASPAPLLAVGAGAWVALVAAMTLAGYAGLPRFMAPAIAVVCALGGAGLVRVVRAVDHRRGLAAGLAALLALAVAIDGGVRAAAIPDQIERAHEDSGRVAALLELAENEPAAFRCPPLWTSEFLVQTPLAWQLDRSIPDIVTTRSVAPASGTLLVGTRTAPGLARAMRRAGEPRARAGGWAVFATGACRASPRADQPPGPSAPAVAGVSGARR